MTPNQRRLLQRLVEASRATPAGAERPFMASSEVGTAQMTLQHPHLQEGAKAYSGDLLYLRHEGFLYAVNELDSGFAFDVTAQGYQAVGAMPGPPRQWGPWIATEDRPLAKSHMSVLWRVRRDGVGDIFALKEMKFAKGRHSAGFRRFVQEIETLGKRLLRQHPGIIEVVDYCLPQEGSEELPYYVMPLAESTLLRASRRLGGRAEEVLQIGVTVADALAAAHTAEVIHRDIKPANILLFGDEHRPVVCDFGICFVQSEDRLTREDAGTVGTDDFVAPELKGGGVSAVVAPRVDVYSLGKTLFTVAAGGDVLPREYLDQPRFDLATRFNDPRLLHLRGVVEMMVRENPEERIQDMTTARALLNRALENVQHGIPFTPGMYGATPTAAERARGILRILETPDSTARRDSLRDATRSSVAEAEDQATAFAHQHPFLQLHYRKRADEAAAAAAAVAEGLLAVGLPYVLGNDVEAFEDWLGRITAVLTDEDRVSESVQKLVLRPAAVLAAFACAAVAWRRQRWHILKLVLGDLAAARTRWTHMTAIPESYDLQAWLAHSVANSEVVKTLDRETASRANELVLLVWGLDVLRALVPMGETKLAAAVDRVRETDQSDFPVGWTPAWTSIDWLVTFFSEMSTSRPVERIVAREVFGIEPAALRTTMRRVGPAANLLVSAYRHRSGRGGAGLFPIDETRWNRWVDAE